jgi:hypothetical protein
MPNFDRMAPKSCWVAPKRPLEATTWSPACMVAIASDRIADMPEAVAMQASPPSSAASRVCIAVTVGLEKRA